MRMIVPIALTFASTAVAAPTTLKLDKDSAEVQEVEVPTMTGTKTTTRICRGHGLRTRVLWPEAPALTLSVDRPTKGMVARVFSTGGTFVAKIVRRGEKAKSCAKLRDYMFFRELKPGQHDIYIGHVKGQAPVATTWMVYNGKKRPPLDFQRKGAFPKPGPGKLPLLTDQFPFSGRADTGWLWLPREVKQGMFMKADPKLYAYAALDFDADSARPWFAKRLGQQAYDRHARGELPVRYPKKGEPLLVRPSKLISGVTVMTADGLDFMVTSREYVTATPPEVVVWPAAPRHLFVTLKEIEKSGTPREKKQVAKLTARRKKADACWYQYMDRRGALLPKGWSMKVVRYSSSGRVLQVSDYGNRVGRQAAAKCGLGRLDRAEGRLIKAAEGTLRKRIQKNLKKLGGG